MLILFTGSREFEDWLLINRVFKRLCVTLGPFDVLHGGAQGVDLYIDGVAGIWHLAAEAAAPDYERYGRYAAPKRRNIKMLERHPDMVVGFWNGESAGTKHCLDFAVNVFRIPTLIYLEGRDYEATNR